AFTERTGRGGPPGDSSRNRNDPTERLPRHARGGAARAGSESSNTTSVRRTTLFRRGTAGKRRPEFATRSVRLAGFRLTPPASFGVSQPPGRLAEDRLCPGDVAVGSLHACPHVLLVALEPVDG